MFLAAAGGGELGTGKELLRQLSERMWQWLMARVQGWLGGEPGDESVEFWALVVTSLVFLGLVLVVSVLVRWIFHRRKAQAEKTEKDGARSWLVLSLEAVRGPLQLLIWICGVFFAVAPFGAIGRAAGICFDVGLFICVLWLFFRLTGVLGARLKVWSKGTSNVTDDILLPLAVRGLRVIVPVMAVVFALPMLGLPESMQSVIYAASSVLIICAVAWVLVQGVFLGEKLILSRYDVKVADNLRARQVHTQVKVLRKTALVVITIVTIALVLMSFDEVRQLGTSILASAGVLGIIIGFAVQKMIANLFAGFQLAMTQPIRLDDVVIVENEWGWIEEITLTYVVVRIWDLRRLVLPISYFIERPFQNWTRVSADILGTVYFHADYRVPLEPLRQELKRIVEQSDKWDKKVVGLIVFDVKETTVQLRALVSAADSGKAWDLRCEVREKLLDFVQRNYPDYLPRFRATIGEAAPGSRPEEKGLMA